MEFAKWLKTNIEERGLNATQFADAIKENQPTIQRILSGETKNPRLKLVKKIEAYFKSEYIGKESQQIHIKDFSFYTDNKRVAQRLEELLNYFVVLDESQQETILRLINDMYGLKSKLNSISRRRTKPVSIEDNKDDKRTERKKA